jgi:hypothetical protein
MLKYLPLEMPVGIEASRSDLVFCCWRNLKLWADFQIPDNEQSVMRVHFPRAEILRVLDEMPLSTEEPPQPVGTVANHLAYRVEQSPFWNGLSEAFKATIKDAKHFRFVTGWRCMDVVSRFNPAFSVVSAKNPPPAV